MAAAWRVIAFPSAAAPRQWLPFAVAVLCATMAVPAILFLTGLPANNLPENDLPADYLLGLWYGLVLTPLVFALPANAEERRVLLFLWLMRVLVVAGPMLVFEGHYNGGDSFVYYDVARRGFYYDYAHWGRASGFPTGTIFMQAVTTTIYNCGLHSFRAIKMTFAMIGLLGVYLFYRAAVLFLRQHSAKLLLTLGLVPSILFWSSAIAKDPLIMFGVSLYSFGAVGLCTRWQLPYLIPAALGLLIGAVVRPWMAPIMCCWLLAAGLTMRGHLATKVVVGALALAAMIFLARGVLTSFSVKSQSEFLETLQQNQRNFAAGGGSKQENVSVGGWGDALKFAPIGAFAAFFRPLPGEVMNLFGMMAGVEDLVFLLLFVRALIRLRPREFADPVIAGTGGMLLIWAFFYAFVSSGNLGTAVRYRLQVLPLLIMLLLYLGRKEDNNRVRGSVHQGGKLFWLPSSDVLSDVATS